MHINWMETPSLKRLRGPLFWIKVHSVVPSMCDLKMPGNIPGPNPLRDQPDLIPAKVMVEAMDRL